MRDYLLVCLIFDNASRPGAIANMTLKEYNNAIIQKDGHVVQVLRHKTAHKGPANISMSSELFRNVHHYIKSMRNMLPGISVKDDDTVFVSWGGSKMESNMITTQMNSFWSRMHNKCHRINPTLVRKFTTTTIHQMKPDLRKDTADLLCHSLRTAENSYALIEKQHKAAGTSKEIRKIQRASTKIPLSSEIIIKEFADEISNRKVTISDVREKVGDHDGFIEIRGNKTEEKRILDTVRYHIKVKEQTDKKNKFPSNSIEMDISGDESPEWEDEDQDKLDAISLDEDCGWQRNKGIRKVFSAHDMELIRQHLDSYINSDCSIRRGEFEKYVKSKQQLKEVLQKFGLTSLIIKMRTERKNH